MSHVLLLSDLSFTQDHALFSEVLFLFVYSFNVLCSLVRCMVLALGLPSVCVLDARSDLLEK